MSRQFLQKNTVRNSVKGCSLHNGTQDDLVHDLPWHRGQTNRSVVCSPPDPSGPFSWNLPGQPGLLVNDWEWWALALAPLVPLCRSQLTTRKLYVTKMCGRSLSISPWIIGVSFFFPFPSSSSGTQRTMGLIIGEVLKGKMVLTTTSVSSSFVIIFPPATNKGWRLPLTLLLLLIYV